MAQYLQGPLDKRSVPADLVSRVNISDFGSFATQLGFRRQLHEDGRLKE